MSLSINRLIYDRDSVERRTCCVVEFCDDSSRGRFEMPPASKTLAKFMAGFFVGFCTNLVICIYVDIQAIENRDNLETLCAKLKGKKDETEEDFQGELNAQIPEPYRPRDMYDLLRYEYMDHRFMYGNFDDEPKIKLLGHQKNDMKGILSQTVTLFKHRNAGDWKFRKVVEMYRRLDPQRGEEYSLTLNLSRITSGQDTNKLYRLSVVKPFSTAQLIAQQPIDLAMRLYMIVPIFNATEKFRKFLLRFEEICIKKKSATVLVVVSFLAHTDKESETDEVASLVQRLSDKYGNRYFRYIHTYQPFSRGLAIDIATNSIPDDKLLFFCDVDIMFSSEFLDRCRTNAVFHQQVFYPVVFSQYQPEFVKAYSPDAESSDLGDINRSTGHWVHYGYGVACMFAGDYRLVGGFDRKLRGWGGEDVNLFSKHVTSQLKIFRAMDPGLIHIYHRKTCDPDKLSANQYRMCEDSRAQAFGSRQQLAKHLVAKGC